jgi:hypothetical protein
MMVDLRVDYIMLDNLRQSLGDVAERLEHIRVDSEVTGRAWGGTVLRRSMEEFVGNWGIHREKVTSALRDLADDRKGVAETFLAVEQG